MRAQRDHTGSGDGTTTPGSIGALRIALRCDLEGRILEILQDTCTSGPENLVGTPLTRLVHDGSTAKAAAFMRTVARNGCAFDWELGIWNGGRVHTLSFAGFRCTEETVIIGATSMNVIMSCLEQFSMINNEQMNELRRLLKARCTSEADAHAYDELTQLNSELANLQRELTKANAELERMARTDTLTGVPNRRDFFERAEAALRRAAHDGRPVAALMFDADRFKSCNDTYGHAAGDRVLIEIARRLAEQMRPEDCFGRFGGEEFAAFLPGCDADGAMRVAERLRAAVAQSPQAISEEGEEIRLTISLGVATMEHARPREDPASLDELMKRADRALYTAKESGRNRVVLWSAAACENRAA